MATLRELTYIVLDELKLSSDDSYFNEEHIAFLISKYRVLLLRQQYKEIKREIPESNLQTMCTELILVPATVGASCKEKTLLRTKEKIPFFMTIYTPKIYADNPCSGEISYISRERMKYVGHNKWLVNAIYASIGTDNYMYLTSLNPQFINLEKIKITGIFENPEKIKDCNADDAYDFWDKEYPLEEGLIPKVVELVVKELTAPKYSPEDKQNDSNDNISEAVQSNRNG